jgi:serine/threonine protein kinase
MQPFQKIDRRYQVLSPLGSGITGEIYKVEGPDGIVALKLLKTHVPGLKPEERITTFKFEFSLLKGLSHPNIVRIFDFGFDETLKRFYFTEELVEGTSIANLFKNTAAIRESHPLHRIKDLFVQALQGLAYLPSDVTRQRTSSLKNH